MTFKLSGRRTYHAVAETLRLGRIRLREVGMRDGLQAEKRVIETDKKIALMHKLIGAGLSEIEVASFVSPKHVPQMGDADKICDDLEYGKAMYEGYTFSALVPNERGFERFRKYFHLSEAGFFVGATDGFNRRNVRATTEEHLARLQPLIEKLKARDTQLRAYVSVAFGCPYEGEVDSARVVELSERLYKLGADEITIGDTIGVATPDKVAKLFGELQDVIPFYRLGFHGHDTYGRGVANAWAAYQAGVRIIDGSVGGLGGCPFAPGATGNTATEDLVDLFENEGVETGVRMDALLDTVNWIQDEMFPERDRIVGGRVYAPLVAKQRRD